MVPIPRDRVESIMPDRIHDKANHGDGKQPPTLFIRGNQIFPYLQANGEDQVAHLIRLSSETYRHSCMENFYLELHLHPPTSTASIRSSTHQFLGWEAYYFDIMACNIEPIPLQVRLFPPRLSKSGRPLTFPKVRVAYNGYWRPIPEFLNIYPPARAIREMRLRQTSQAFYNDQWRWWAGLSKLPLANPMHKVFRLLELPGEFRELIYGYIFPSPLRPFTGAKCRGLSGMSRMRFEAEQPETTILYLNKQIYHEASRVLFCDTTWEISHPYLLEKIRHSRILKSQVQRLHLKLSHEDLIALFDPDNDASVARLRSLRSMKLRSLVVEFGSPPGLNPASNWETGSRGKLACQRLVIDWVLQAAESSVVGHEGVSVVGWVKKYQKNAFEGLCKAGLKEFRRWKEISGKEDACLAEWDDWEEEMGKDEDGGVRLVEVEVDPDDRSIVAQNGSEVSEERVSGRNPSRSPPECLCEVSCDRMGWTAEN